MMVRKLLLVVSAGFMIGIMAHLNSQNQIDARKGSSKKEPGITVMDTGCSLIPCAYAAKKGGKGGKGGKGKGKDKDKDRGPSVPGIPMVAAALIGLGGIGAAAYFLKKKKK